MSGATGLADRVLAFRVGDRLLGLPAALVREIVPVPRMSRVPHAPAALLGLANVRGHAVPILSVARLIGEADADIGRVIVADLDGPVGLAVSAVSRMAGETDGSDISCMDIGQLIARAMPERRAPVRMSAEPQQNAEAAAIAERAFVSLDVGAQEFAFALDDVDEIRRLPEEIAIVPHADAVVIGTVAIRSQVVPLLSLAGLLGLPGLLPTRRSRIVMVRIGRHRVGLVVDGIRSVERVAEIRIDPVPEALNRGGEARIQAICRIGDGERLLSVLSCDQLLREDLTARLLDGAEGSEDTTDDSAMQQGERFVLFRISGERYALPVSEVQEIALLPERLTPLPKAPDFVQGVMTVRGEVIPVIDQARRFNGTPVAGGKPRVIVVRIGEITAGFVVDTVSEVVPIPDDCIGKAPDLGTGETRVFDRVASLGDEIVLVVDPQELLDRAERDLLASVNGSAAKPQS
ncbi:chemotaxis protein CheW [Novosphingobium sp. BL-8H]|uniref:chemotaxis protein CheW n=1 Tax=Novosphingobium sp. BL-8H TaxID=3127640 RepID=UPI0037570874